ncbi:adenosylmethionine decarboxylase [Candidatus Kapabacteria bacterium]|nr:adenosylmethionine decarboxylase [Candidatus Kapabacteria bacterium]
MYFVNPHNGLGSNYLIDMYGLEANSFYEDDLELKLRSLAKEFNCTPIKFQNHRFSPQGYTAVLLLKESHLSIHTWPEKDYIAIDFFSCGAIPEINFVKETIASLFKAKFVNIEKVVRGNHKQNKGN